MARWLGTLVAIALLFSGPGAVRGQAEGRRPGSDEWRIEGVSFVPRLGPKGVPGVLLAEQQWGVDSPGPGRVSGFDLRDGALLFVTKEPGNCRRFGASPVAFETGGTAGGKSWSLAWGTPPVSSWDASGGMVHLVDEATGSVVSRIPSPPGVEYFAQDLASIGDLDGDGSEDLVVAARGAGGTGGYFAGAVLAVSTGTGKVLWTAHGGEKFTGLGLGGLLRVGDIDGDGKQDVIARCQSFPLRADSPRTFVRALAGGSGKTIWEYSATGARDIIGGVVRRWKDVDRDGHVDLAFRMAGWKETTLPPRVLLSAATGKPLGPMADHWTREGEYPSAEILHGDVDADGTPDILGAREVGSDGAVFTRYFLVSGRTGKDIRPLVTGLSDPHILLEVVEAGDLSGDEVPDFVIVGMEEKEPRTIIVETLSGATGRVLRRIVPASK